jgi:N6-L-threonylcarbamoyladenine synthase
MEFEEIETPYICLLVSGGHTMIVDVKAFGDYEIIGQSVDDAVGEAFDKVGKLLELPYPGGPHIERIALDGDPGSYKFPRPMLHSDDLNLSFSGLKTSVLYKVKEIDQMHNSIKSNIAASFQAAVIEVLVKKITKTIESTGRKEIIIAGGVAANKKLRSSMKELESALDIKVFYPDLKYCGDNAAMIAYLGSLRGSSNNKPVESCVRARWPLSELS